MSDYFVEELKEPLIPQNTTFTCQKVAYAFEDKILVEYTVQFDANQKPLLQASRKMDLKKTIQSLFAVPELNLLLVHVDTKLLMVNSKTFKVKTLTDVQNVSGIVPHSPGFFPQLVPLSFDVQAQRTYDLSHAPIHTTYSGCNEAIFATQKPYIPQTGKFGLFDFMVIQDGTQMTIYNVANEGCTQNAQVYSSEFGSTVIIDDLPGQNYATDPFASTFHPNPYFTEVTYGSSRISGAVYISEYLLFYTSGAECSTTGCKNYYHLNVKQFSFLEQLMLQRGIPLFTDVATFSSVVISYEPENPLHDQQLTVNPASLDQQCIRTVGTNCALQELVQPTIEEINRRLRSGIAMDLVPRSVAIDGYGSLMNSQERQLQLLDAKYANQQVNMQDVIYSFETYDFLKQHDGSVGYGLLNEQHHYRSTLGAACGLPFIDAVKVGEIELLANSGLHKLVDSIVEEIKAAPQKQKQPFVYIAMPVIIAMEMGKEMHLFEIERWDRSLLLQSCCPGLVETNIYKFGVEEVVLSRDLTCYNVNGKNNEISGSELADAQIITFPLHSGNYAESISTVLEHESEVIECSSFYFIGDNNRFFQLSKNKHSSLLIEKLIRVIEDDSSSISVEEIIAERNNANVILGSLNDQLESSKINTCIGLMYFSQNMFYEAVINFLEARELNPVSVIQLFLHDTTVDYIANPNFPQVRTEQPPIDMIEHCELLGTYFKKLIISELGDEYWVEICGRCGNRPPNYYQYINQLRTTEEQLYCQRYQYMKFEDVFGDFLSAFYNNQEHDVLVDIVTMTSHCNALWRSNPNGQDADYVLQKLKNLTYFLRVYLDVRSNWTSPLRDVLRGCHMVTDKVFLDQFITPNVNLINNKEILRLDEQILVLRTFFVILLSVKPFNIRSANCIVFYLNRPEEMRQLSNVKKAPAVLTNTKTELQSYQDTLGLLMFLSHHSGASRLADMLRRNDQNRYDEYSYYICLNQCFGEQMDCGVDEGEGVSQNSLYTELQQLQLDEISQKNIFWKFIPYMILKQPKEALKLLLQQLTYKYSKTEKIVQQYLFFEKMPLRESGSLVGYYKPQKDDSIRQFSQDFTPDVVEGFLEEIRSRELHERQVTELARKHHRGLANLALFYFSKCVNFAFSDYFNGVYLKRAPDWKQLIAKQWLCERTGDIIRELITAYCDNDEPQRKFAQSCVVQLEPVVVQMKKVLSFLDGYIRGKSGEQAPKEDSAESTQQYEQSELNTLVDIKLPEKAAAKPYDEQQSQIESVEANCHVIPEKLLSNPSDCGSQMQSSDDGSKQAEQKEESKQFLKIWNLVNPDMIAELRERQLADYSEEMRIIYASFYQPYILASLKSGETQNVINSLFVQTFVEPKFDVVYSIVWHLHKNGLLRTRICDTNVEQLQEFISRIDTRLQGLFRRKYTLDINQLEASINNCLILCEPFVKTLVKEGEFDSVEKCVQCDCLAFIELDQIGMKDRSPVNLLYELLSRYNLVYQLHLITPEVFHLIIRRFTNIETKSGEYLAKYAGLQIMDLLPTNYPMRSFGPFVILSLKLITNNSSELAIEKLKNDYQYRVLREECESLKRGQQSLNSFVQCEICGKSILRQGTMESKYVIMQDDAGMNIVHEDCYDKEYGDK